MKLYMVDREAFDDKKVSGVQRLQEFREDLLYNGVRHKCLGADNVVFPQISAQFTVALQQLHCEQSDRKLPEMNIRAF